MGPCNRAVAKVYPSSVKRIWFFPIAFDCRRRYTCIYNERRVDDTMARKQPKNTENTIASECIAMRLRMLNRVTTRIYDDALRPLGLRSSQLTILVAAARLGVARPAELSERLQIEVSTLSRNLERLKEKGWLEVIPDEDGRAQPMRLTRKGRALLERAKPKWDEAQIEIKELLGADAFDTIEEAAQRVRGRNLK